MSALVIESLDTHTGIGQNSDTRYSDGAEEEGSKASNSTGQRWWKCNEADLHGWRSSNKDGTEFADDAHEEKDHGTHVPRFSRGISR